jgi:propionyl-CoA synthetase
MIAEAAMAMLACARIGAVHSVVFGGFAANELATRINDAKPKVIVSASCGIEIKKVIALQTAVGRSHRDLRPQAGQVRHPATPHGGATMIQAATWTGSNKWGRLSARLRAGGGHRSALHSVYLGHHRRSQRGRARQRRPHAVALKWTMKAVYNVEAGDVYWAASDVGWVVGHSYIVYAPLLAGLHHHPVRRQAGGYTRRRCVLAGDFPAQGQEHVHRPHGLPGHQAQDPTAELMKNYDLSNFKALFLAGERTDPDTLKWAETNLGVPVIDHWWQTETGWAICANCMGLHHFPVKGGLSHQTGPGWNLQVVDAGNPRAGKGRARSAPWWSNCRCRREPCPPCGRTTPATSSPTWRSFRAITRPPTPDLSTKTATPTSWRVPTTSSTWPAIGFPPAPWRRSWPIIPDVAECAVLGVDDKLKGQVPIGFLVLNAGVERDHQEIVAEVMKMVRESIGPVASFKTATVVKRLPKTRSGKILRGTIQKIADNKEWKAAGHHRRSRHPGRDAWENPGNSRLRA